MYRNYIPGENILSNMLIQDIQIKLTGGSHKLHKYFIKSQGDLLADTREKTTCLENSHLRTKCLFKDLILGTGRTIEPLCHCQLT